MPSQIHIRVSYIAVDLETDCMPSGVGTGNVVQLPGGIHSNIGI